MFSKDPDGIAIAAFVSLFYAFGLLLFRVNQFILAWFVWLFGASASNLEALVFAHPLTDVDYVFLPIVALTFFAFSWKNECVTLVFVCHPATAGLVRSSLLLDERQLYVLF